MLMTTTEADAVVAKWCEEYRLAEADILGPSRLQEVAECRHLIMAELREAGWTLVRIGRYLGGRAHTTVLRGVVHAKAIQATPSPLARRAP